MLEKKPAAKKSAKRKGFYAKIRIKMCENLKEKNYTPWTEKCQFLLVAFYRFLNVQQNKITRRSVEHGTRALTALG